MAEDNKVEAMLEHLGARFELLIEGLTSSGQRLDALREEVFGQFAEVGRQISFLSEHIGENRSALKALHADLAAEIARLGEALGAARVELHGQLAQSRDELDKRIDGQAQALREELAKALAAAAAPQETRAARAGLKGEAAPTREQAKREITQALEAGVKKLGAEISKSNKAFSNFVRKFERFDDRVSVATKDHEMRLKKLERASR